MTNAIVEALAFENGSSGVNLDDGGDHERKYLEAACASLVSARRHNPDDDVLLCSNVEIPNRMTGILRRNGIRILDVPFDSFRFEDDCPWRLAYYKLCAMERILDLGGHGSVCLLDMDVWVKGPFREMFEQSRSEGSVLMIDMHARPSNADRVAMDADKRRLGLNPGGTFWGGELLCGTAEALGSHLDGCRRAFDRMVEAGVRTERGDEFLHYCTGGGAPLPTAMPRGSGRAGISRRAGTRGSSRCTFPQRRTTRSRRRTDRSRRGGSWATKGFSDGAASVPRGVRSTSGGFCRGVFPSSPPRLGTRSGEHGLSRGANAGKAVTLCRFI